MFTLVLLVITVATIVAIVNLSPSKLIAILALANIALLAAVVKLLLVMVGVATHAAKGYVVNKVFTKAWDALVAVLTN